MTAADPAKIAALRQAEPVTVKDFIDVTARKRAAAFNRTADLKLDIAEACVRMAHPKLEKILVEILDNAFKFSEPGAAVEVSGQILNDFYEVTIVNHGRGMTPEQITALGAHMQFERKFYEQQGAGLGFAIARRLIEIHGGSAKVSSIHGTSATVDLFFPMWTPQSDR